jgi:transformation/transcription domain-associated protein
MHPQSILVRDMTDEEETRTMEALETPKQGTKRPLDGMNWETIRKSLIGKDMKDALKAGTELKERIEIGPSREVSSILTTLVPTFSSVLSSITRPNPESSSDENCLRKVVLEAVSRMPKDDTMRPHAHTLLDVCMDVLAKDYEDNALLASKIIFDLHKNFRSMPQDQVQPYLDFVQQVYRSLPTSVEKNFHFPSGVAATGSTLSVTDTPLSAQDSSSTLDKDFLSILPGDKNDLSPYSGPSSGLPSSPTPKVAVKSTSSFRVLTECPLTVMLLFQLYPKFLKTNIPTLIQLMMEALAIRSPPLQSLVKSKIETYHKRLYYNRSRELVAAQVKTLSFLTYLLRGFADQMKPYEDRIATNVVSLMTSCPRESIGTRKELMVATRHILATDFRKGFFRHVDSLLDERILMGSHRHSDQTIIRPLGYSTLADLVLHVRSMLTLKQLSKVVCMFSRVLHDSSMKLPVSIQLTAVRLLLNVVDIIYNNKDANPQVGRDLLDRILDALVNKLGTLKDSVDSVRQGAVRELRREGAQLQHAASTDSTETKTKFGDDNDVGHVKKEDSLGNVRVLDKSNIIDADEWLVEDTSSFDTIRDKQSMIRSIIAGLKTVIWCITNYRIPKDKEKPTPGAADEAAEHVVRLSKFERDLVDKYIEFAIPCIQIFTPLPLIPDDAGSLPNNAWEQQERDVVTYFASFFAVLDSFSLRRTLGAKIDLLVDTLVQSPNAMLFPRHLLGSNPKTSLEFCEILLAYLVDHIDLLSVSIPSGLVFLPSDPDVDNSEVENNNTETGRKLLLEMEVMSSLAIETREKTASILLELFERIIKSLAAFPENEHALRPYLQKIVVSALHLSMEKGDGWPDNYCSLLRSVFRSISAGKFEESFKELLPMIPIILNGLHRIFQSTVDEPLQNFVVEMCLTIPARLSSLLPHMPLLLRMIIASLNASEGDLVNLGYELQYDLPTFVNSSKLTCARQIDCAPLNSGSTTLIPNFCIPFFPGKL